MSIVVDKQKLHKLPYKKNYGTVFYMGGRELFKKKKNFSLEKNVWCERVKFTLCGAQCPLTKQRLCYSGVDAVDPEPL